MNEYTAMNWKQWNCMERLPLINLLYSFHSLRKFTRSLHKSLITFHDLNNGARWIFTSFSCNNLLCGCFHSPFLCWLLATAYMLGYHFVITLLGCNLMFTGNSYISSLHFGIWSRNAGISLCSNICLIIIRFCAIGFMYSYPMENGNISSWVGLWDITLSSGFKVLYLFLCYIN